jgi:SPP1 family predicted phage head-tail adaptor
VTQVSIRAGDLNRRVSFEERLGSKRDTAGQVADQWRHVVTCWAHIEQLSGNELVIAQAINTEITHKVTVRYRTNLTTAMRCVYGSRQFNVLSILDPETAHVALHVMCSEGLAENDRAVH